MKIAKRVFFLVVGLIAVIAIGFYLFLQIREVRSRNVLVHGQSQSIVKIAVDRILWDIARNAITHPGYYRQEGKTPARPGASMRPDEAVAIPANLYFFSTESDTLTFYAMLKVKDEQVLKVSLQYHLGIDSSAFAHDKGYWYVSSENKRFSFVGNDKEVLMAVNLDRLDKIERLRDMWHYRSKMMKPIKEMEGFDFGKEKADIVYYDRWNKNTATADFGQGKIISTADIALDLIHLTDKPQARVLPVGNVLNFYCHADLKPLFEKYRHTLSNYNIPIDTLKQYYGGYMDIQWKQGGVLQQDTVVAYDYDDSFELIPKKEVREEAVPNLILTLRMSPHLGAYLPQKIFYVFHQARKEDLIGLSTAAQFENSYAFEDTGQAFHMVYNRDASVMKYLGWMPCIDRIQSWKICGKRAAEKRTEFKSELTMADPHIHALAQLITD